MKNWLILGGILLAIVGASFSISTSEPPVDFGGPSYRPLPKETPRMTEAERVAAELKRKEADRVAKERRARYEAGLPVEENAWGDELQQLFLKLTPKTTREEIESYVSNSKLYLNKDNFDYKIAFRESDAYFKRGTGGDSVTILFDRNWNISTATYFNGETMREAVIGSGNTPDDKATYLFIDMKSGIQEECLGTHSAIIRTLNLKDK